MGMSEFYGTGDDDESIATIHRALDLGVTFLDTSDMYGPYLNEQLVGPGHRRPSGRGGAGHQVRYLPRAATRPTASVRGDPAYVRQACDASLGRLGVDHIDLYYQHRTDGNVPIEDTVGAMAELVVGGQGPLPGPVRGAARHDAPGLCRPSHRRAAERVVAVEPGHRGTESSTRPGSSGSASWPTARSAGAS